MADTILPPGASSAFCFVVGLMRSHWGKQLGADTATRDFAEIVTPALDRMKQDLDALRTADMKTAHRYFRQGMGLLHAVPYGQEWREDLGTALKKSEDAFSRVQTAEEKIHCFQVACACLLATRERKAAVVSIANHIRELLQVQHIDASLHKFAEVVQWLFYRPQNINLLHRGAILLMSAGTRNSVPYKDVKMVGLVLGSLSSVLVACRRLDVERSALAPLNQVLSESQHISTAVRYQNCWGDVTVSDFSSLDRGDGFEVSLFKVERSNLQSRYPELLLLRPTLAEHVPEKVE